MTPSDSPPRPSAELQHLITRARAVDGSPPFSDGALVELERGTRELVRVGEAVALVSATEAEFVVDPDARRHGHGTRMLHRLTTGAQRLFWAHGDHPGSRALAAAFGLVPARRLLHLEAAVAASVPEALEGPDALEGPEALEGPGHAGHTSRTSVSEGATLRPFTPEDAEAWLALNARAFAGHPEQGTLTRADLDVLLAEPWFDPEDFLLLWDGDELLGFCWLKREGGEGEFYVVGVAPHRQGEGIGRELVTAGFARLASVGIPTAHLYVEGDNAAALALYRSFGFTERSVDVQYRSP